MKLSVSVSQFHHLQKDIGLHLNPEVWFIIISCNLVIYCVDSSLVSQDSCIL